MPPPLLPLLPGPQSLVSLRGHILPQIQVWHLVNLVLR